MFLTGRDELGILLIQKDEFETTQKHLREVIMPQNTDPNIHFTEMTRFPAIRFSLDPFEEIPEECTARSIGSDRKAFGWGKAHLFDQNLRKQYTYEEFHHLITIARIIENEEPLDEKPTDSTDEYMKMDSYNVELDKTEPKWFRLDPNIHIFLGTDLMRDYKGLYVRVQIIDKTEYPHEYIELLQNVIYFPLYSSFFFL